MGYGTGIRLRAGFEDTAARVREALKEQGFGVLTEIDVRATLKEKLGEEMEPRLILGACNPPLAHRGAGRGPTNRAAVAVQRRGPRRRRHHEGTLVIPRGV